jgi:glycosyltransferase involved in cell wall biosynthesis
VGNRYHPRHSAEIQAVCAKHAFTRPYILYVGSIEARKNLDCLLEAYARFRMQAPEYKLVVVGARKWKTSAIFATMQRLQLMPHVHFTGFVEDEDLPALYSGASMFVFPSLYEGFGFPVLEAMACGTPVITSCVSSLPEVAGDAALLIDPRNAEEITRSMLCLLQDQALAASLREKGLRQAQRFSWQQTAQQTLKVYEYMSGNDTSRSSSFPS